MATIKLETYPAKRDGAFISVSINIFGNNPTPIPARTIVTTKTAEVLAEIERIKAEAEAIDGKPGLAIYARVTEGRSPAGFKAATARATYVNV